MNVPKFLLFDWVFNDSGIVRHIVASERSPMGKCRSFVASRTNIIVRTSIDTEARGVYILNEVHPCFGDSCSWREKIIVRGRRVVVENRMILDDRMIAARETHEPTVKILWLIHASMWRTTSPCTSAVWEVGSFFPPQPMFPTAVVPETKVIDSIKY